MPTREQMARLLPLLDTSALAQPDAPTRALVVFNPGGEPATGRVRFAATFPVRAGVGPQPVVVRDGAGAVVPSRLAVSETREDAALPPGRVWWRMALEFAARDVPPDGWRTYAATFATTPHGDEDAAFWDALPPLPLPVIETECHAGSLPPISPPGFLFAALAALPAQEGEEP